MTHNNFWFAFILSAAFSAVAAATPVTIATNTYGKAKTGAVVCNGSSSVPCSLPDGVTVFEQSYRSGQGELYDFNINSLPPAITGYDFTLTGSGGLVGGSDYGAFVCGDLPRKTKTQCGVNPADVNVTSETVTTTQSLGRRKKTKSVTTSTSVTFSVNGDNTDLVFYAIFFPTAVINADLTFHPSTLDVPQTLQTVHFDQLVATPEPRLLLVLAIAMLVLGLLHFRRRQAEGKQIA